MSAPAYGSDCDRPAVYRRRRPQRTVLYQVVQENLESWLAERQAADAESGGVPRWVEQVHGVQRLRVADASIMPVIINANTNAACIMIGEKCADMVSKAASA